MIAQPLYRITLTSSERAELERLVRGHSTPQIIARRARIILMANEEAMSNAEIAACLGIDKAKITLWTQRWVERGLEPVRDRLSDRPRPGAPDTITPEQWCRVIALACESPQDHGYPTTHWSGRELAAEAIKQGIVERLSAGHLRKVLQKKRCTHIASATGSTPRPTPGRTNGSRTSAPSTKRRHTAPTNWS